MQRWPTLHWDFRHADPRLFSFRLEVVEPVAEEELAQSVVVAVADAAGQAAVELDQALLPSGPPLRARVTVTTVTPGWGRTRYLADAPPVLLGRALREAQVSLARAVLRFRWGE